MIQSIGGRKLPTTYNIAVRVENSLIREGKISPRPPMPLFPEISQVPQNTLALIHVPEKIKLPVTSTSYSLER